MLFRRGSNQTQRFELYAELAGLRELAYQQRVSGAITQLTFEAAIEGIGCVENYALDGRVELAWFESEIKPSIEKLLALRLVRLS